MEYRLHLQVVLPSLVSQPWGQLPSLERPLSPSSGLFVSHDERASTCVLDAFLNEVGSTHDLEVWLEVADQSPKSRDIRIRSSILGIKQLQLVQFCQCRIHIGNHGRDEQSRRDRQESISRQRGRCDRASMSRDISRSSL